MFFIMVGIAIVAAIFLNRTIWGRYIRALGSQRRGRPFIRVFPRIGMIILAYIICSITGNGAWRLHALRDRRQGSILAESSFGNFYELYAIAAAVHRRLFSA